MDSPEELFNILSTSGGGRFLKVQHFKLFLFAGKGKRLLQRKHSLSL